MRNSQSVYDQHRAHNARTGAFAILLKGTYVASVSMAYPRDNAGRLYAYVHWIGTEMVRGIANRYGYDKRTRAVASAACKRLKGWSREGSSSKECQFWEHLALDDGKEWTDQLRACGFSICQVC